MSHPARRPARGAGIGGKANAAGTPTRRPHGLPPMTRGGDA